MASLSYPYMYPATAGADLAIPSTLMAPSLKKFSGARTVIKSVPSASGSVGPSSTMLFNLPTGPGTGYIKSGSVYLRCKVQVTITGGAGVTWAFAGQGSTTTQSTTAQGGASSLIDRMIVSVGGVQASVINNYNHWRNAVVPHATTYSYFYDLQQMEYAGALKTATTDVDTNKIIYVAIPILAPIFNADSSIPTFLLNGGPISVEIATATANSAFYAVTAVGGVSNYTISEASLVYESIEVSEEFKNAMRQKVASEGGYNIHLEDIYNLSIATSTVVDYNIGLSLSSLKGVCWTEQLTDNNSASLAKPKWYTPNALSDAKVYVDNQLVNNVVIDNDAVAYIEMNRALGRITDSSLGSYITASTTMTTLTNKRSSYCDANFLGGVSTSVVSDWGFTSSGVPCNQLTLHLEHVTTADIGKWGLATANSAAAVVYVFVMYDSILNIDPLGAVSIRK
jgi:hypothetical protein